MPGLEEQFERQLKENVSQLAILVEANKLIRELKQERDALIEANLRLVEENQRLTAGVSEVLELLKDDENKENKKNES